MFWSSSNILKPNFIARHSASHPHKVRQMKKDFKLDIGFSDHSKEVYTGGLATMLGANILEKHITLNKNLIGPDHKASLEPKEFSEYVKISKNANLVLGNGRKVISLIEKKTKKTMQKSIFLNRSLNKNQKISLKDIIIMRPATGISPILIDNVVGKRLKKKINRFQKFKLSDLKKK